MHNFNLFGGIFFFYLLIITGLLNLILICSCTPRYVYCGLRLYVDSEPPGAFAKFLWKECETPGYLEIGSLWEINQAPGNKLDTNRLVSAPGKTLTVNKEGYFEKSIVFPNYGFPSNIIGLRIPETLECVKEDSPRYYNSGYYSVKLTPISTRKYRNAFETHLDRREYEKAEVVRREWAKFIKSIPEKNRTESLRSGLDKLEGVIGLTDTILVPLREKLLQKLNNEDYESALKIQQLIINREAQLRPPPPPQQTIVIRESSEGKDRVINVQSPEVKVPDKIVVEQKQRYGVTDVVDNLMKVQGKQLADKDKAGFKLIDILLGR